jgi:polyisoprenyl-phosphate glycosyltransferase
MSAAAFVREAPKTVVLIPVFDDWEAVTYLLRQLDALADTAGLSFVVLLVDDGSNESAETGVPVYTGISEVTALHLRRNLGHQRAIAVGLCHVEANVPCDVVVVMDGDGEDRPEDVPRLLDELRVRNEKCVIFAERTRRSEDMLFLALYYVYCWLHRALTGERVRVGNFSAIPRLLLARLVAVSDLWNHYAAAVFKSKLPYATIPTNRGHRYAGNPRMSFVALVTHGLSAMAAFGDRIGVRLLSATLGLTLAIVAVCAAVVVLRLLSLIEIPTWAPYGIAIIVLLLFQASMMSLVFVFIILAGRDSSTFLPLRDYQYYVLSVERLHPAPHVALSVRR